MCKISKITRLLLFQLRSQREDAVMLDKARIFQNGLSVSIDLKFQNKSRSVVRAAEIPKFHLELGLLQKNRKWLSDNMQECIVSFMG